MNVKIKLHPNSRQEKIKEVSQDFYEVWINEKPINNKANIYLEKFLKKCFKKEVKVIKGLKSKEKIVEVK